MPNTRQRVLHVLRCASMAGTGKVVARTGEPEEAVRPVLAALVDDGLLRHRERPAETWVLLSAAREEHQAWLISEVSARGVRDDVHALYERFLGMNPLMLQLCNDWQVREVDGEQVPNDHGDEGYDAAIVARLGSLDDQLQPILADLAALLPWTDGHAARFTAARRRVEAGEREWLTSIRIDSYHTLWFELHEELMASLGVTREQEAETLAARG